MKLTVVHDGFEPGSAMLESVSGGWPIILSTLKTLLETGETLQSSFDTSRHNSKSSSIDTVHDL